MVSYKRAIALGLVMLAAVACDQGNTGRKGCPHCGANQSEESVDKSVSAVHRGLVEQLSEDVLCKARHGLPIVDVSQSLEEHMLQIQEQYELLDNHNALKMYGLQK